MLSARARGMANGAVDRRGRPVSLDLQRRFKVAWSAFWGGPSEVLPKSDIAGASPAPAVLNPAPHGLRTAPIPGVPVLEKPRGDALLPDAPLPDTAQQRAQFWSTATHDLCQPAQALALFLDRLQRLPADAKTQQLHAYLDSSMQDLTRLLQGLLEVARLDAGQVHPVHAPVAVDALLRRVAQQVAPQAQSKGLRLRVRTAGQWVQSDVAILEPIVVALAHNAVRFTDRGTVLLSARPCDQGTGVRIDVSDSGIGIAERDHPKVFAPFAQRNLARQAEALRPSLGLFIAQGHAGVLGSRLQLRSALGRGSRFSLVLPRVPSPTPHGQAEAGGASLGLQGLRLALLDGQAQRRDDLQGLLQAWGCTVHLAESVQVLQDLHLHTPLGGVVLAWDASSGLPSGVTQYAKAAAGAPVCVIYAPAPVPVAPFSEGQAIVYLADPLQPGQLRAWLRRLPQAMHRGLPADYTEVL